MMRAVAAKEEAHVEDHDDDNDDDDDDNDDDDESSVSPAFIRSLLCFVEDAGSSADHNDAGDNDAISLNLLTLSPIQAVSLQPSSGACFAKEAGPREGLEGDWEGEDLKVQMMTICDEDVPITCNYSCNKQTKNTT